MFLVFLHFYNKLSLNKKKNKKNKETKTIIILNDLRTTVLNHEDGKTFPLKLRSLEIKLIHRHYLH